MRIHSIRVEGFKRFRDPMTLGDLQPGINLICAPNGSGKSTLAEAIRVGFLERHRTGTLALEPWTQPGASPSVQIEFDRSGKKHRLAKTFGSKKSCTLDIEGSKPLSGDEAEQLLSDMFSFSYSGKGASRPEHQGIPGLLWVQQGHSGHIADRVSHAHEYISRALGDDIGELAATAGDRVIDKVETELAVLHTKGGKPTGEYARMVDRLTSKTDELGQMQAKVLTYNNDVDRYARAKDRHAAGERDRPWENQRAQIGTAQQSLHALEQRAGRLREVQLQLKIADSRVLNFQNALGVFDEEDRALSQRQQDLVAAQERSGNVSEEARVAETALHSAQEAESQARQTAIVARRAAIRRSHQDALDAAQQRRAELHGQLEAIQGHLQELAEHQASVARLAGFGGAGKKLLAAESKVSEAKAELNAVSTRLTFALEGEGVSLAGEAITGAGMRTISEPVEIAISGMGSISVLPGAKDLSQLRSDCDNAQAELDQLLQRLGAATAEAARQSELDHVAAVAAVERLQAVLEGIAPSGIDALREQINLAQGDEQRHSEALAALPGDGQIEQGLNAQAAEAAETVTRLALSDAQAAHEAVREEVSKVQEQLRLARRELGTAQANVNAADREEKRRELRADLVMAQARQQTHAVEITEISEEIEKANPDLIRSDIERLTRSADALEAEHGRSGAELSNLSGQLQAQGALGLQEQCAALEDEVTRLQRQVGDWSRRGAALAYLLNMLNEKRAEVARSIRAPLQKHMDRYLAIQFPGTTIDLDEGLRPQRISRTNQYGLETGTFEQLSGGEREQVGIIARLAYADLLMDAGKPTLVMLDDSLVNSDRDNLAQMKRVLYDAAQRHQILIFSCHQENWLDLGVAPRSLQ